MNEKLHLLFAIVMYVSTPRQYSYIFCVCLCAFFLLIAVKSVIIEFKIGRYLSFNLIFMISLFLCTFIIPIFLQPFGYILFSGFDEYINFCTSLVVLAAAIYNLGWYHGINKANFIKCNEINIKPFSSKILKIFNFLSLLAILYYFITFRQTINADLDNSDLGVASYTTILQTILTLSLIIHKTKLL